VFHVKRSACGLSDDVLEALESFAALLLRWNRRINLISAQDEANLWDRHIADSLQLARLIRPIPSHAIDLGSGAGFPGLILALASGITFDLIEADHRKAAFLREAVRITGASARIHATRIEAAGLMKAPLVTARGLAPLPALLTLAAPLLAPGGQCLFLKGARAQTELTDSQTQWHMRVERIPSRTAPDACVLRISDLSRVDPTA
jgi:16S rRNA (guanine527-N7)-methyltransferase